MIVVIARGEDTHYLDTERKPKGMGIQTFCGVYEIPSEQVGNETGVATCLRCRQIKLVVKRGSGPSVFVPNPKREKPA